jgi:carbamoyl-phosphate synthase small subunit
LIRISPTNCPKPWVVRSESLGGGGVFACRLECDGLAEPDRGKNSRIVGAWVPLICGASGSNYGGSQLGGCEFGDKVPGREKEDTMVRAAKLALENGIVFSGTGFGADGEIYGEVVFNTSMTGYQEILSDPSYAGQIVTMAYPMIGNVGACQDDMESCRPFVSGFVVRQNSPISSNFRSEQDLEEFLQRHNVVGIEGIDTRKLVRMLRDQGAMRGVISTTDLDDASLVEKARRSPSMEGSDWVRTVVTEGRREWQESLSAWWHGQVPGLVTEPAASAEETSTEASDAPGLKVAVLDFGMKWNIARHLRDQGFEVIVLPGTCSADEVLACAPDGVMLSNGPGDPEPLVYAQQTVRELLGKLPIFGICLGHQILALACGAKTFKLKFGHRGTNQPVQHLKTQKIEITAQNHGFAVEEATLPGHLRITHRHMNDQTIAGIAHTEFPAFGVQYHPEASGGPHDSQYLFGLFREMIVRFKASNAGVVAQV